MIVKENALFEEIALEVLRVEGALYPHMVQGEKKIIGSIKVISKPLIQKKKLSGRWYSFLNSCR